MPWIKLQMGIARTKGGSLPDFIIPGFQKCATTALWKNLDQHPQIHMATFATGKSGQVGKEFNFFYRRTRRKMKTQSSLLWYMKHFRSDGRLWGESSPVYTMNPQVCAPSMHRIVPGAKLIFCMRNPIERAYSAFNHYLQEYPKSKDWGDWDPEEGFIHNLEHSHSFTRVSYSGSLKAYLEHYPLERIHLIIQERLQAKPQDAYDRIFNFLGLDGCHIENESVHTRHYPTALSTEERRMAARYFEQDVEQLRELMQCDIPEWQADFPTG